ncbi:MAG: hypothetical protein QM765_42370 [Myxococcales bacterium]
MRSPFIIVVLSATLALPVGCSKSQQPAPAEESEVEEQQDDTSDFGQFKKSKKKKRKKKHTKPSTPPTRQEGLEALEEGRMLIEEAEFVSAERELRVAAAAGVEGGDKMLLRVRSELAAEQNHPRRPEEESLPRTTPPPEPTSAGSHRGSSCPTTRARRSPSWPSRRPRPARS